MHLTPDFESGIIVLWYDFSARSFYFFMKTLQTNTKSKKTHHRNTLITIGNSMAKTRPSSQKKEKSVLIEV